MTTPAAQPDAPRYHLSDPDNRDDQGASYEFTGTADQIVAYLDGPVRADTVESNAYRAINRAITSLRAVDFEAARASARRVGVYLSKVRP
ncbi:hypothetical protein [Zhihengliuella halotolerans]|uniref:hypothetical protein n=1 Tax=Zhihengliuella halotolerans TaxID=370736 RepID=UPI000C7FE84C|nr:hypothetical protein [Zhihengliuella halotolerans]